MLNIVSIPLGFGFRVSDFGFWGSRAGFSFWRGHILHEANPQPSTLYPRVPPQLTRQVPDVRLLSSEPSTFTHSQGTPDFPMCGFSNRAVQILDHHAATYGAFNVLEDMEVREGVKKYS